MQLKVEFSSKKAEKLARGLLARAFNRSHREGIRMEQEILKRISKIHQWSKEDKPFLNLLDQDNEGKPQALRMLDLLAHREGCNVTFRDVKPSDMRPTLH